MGRGERGAKWEGAKREGAKWEGVKREGAKWEGAKWEEANREFGLTVRSATSWFRFAVKT
jgi:hypothetical protein